jgi:hypothetical protein
MPSPNWTDDNELMRDLGEALAPVPVEERVLAAARGAFAWRAVYAGRELARMFYDSYLDEAVLVRGDPSVSPRTLVFRSEHVDVEIELGEAGIEGQLVPPGPGRITLVTAAGARTETTTDEVGCFAFAAPPRGPVRLECSVPAGSFLTEWITV